MSAPRRSFVFALLVAVCAAPAPARAHDFWIEPLDYRPCPGAGIQVRLRIGHLDDTLPFVRQAAHQRAFFSVDALGRRPVPGTEGRDPVGLLEVRAPGPIVLGYRSHAQHSELPAARFEAYLREEGFAEALAWRRRHARANEPGVESLERFAKSLLRAGDRPMDAGHARPFGFALELLALDDPYALGPGRALRVLLLEDGAPRPGARISAYHARGLDTPVTARTAADGVAQLALPHAGEWLLRALSLQRPQAPGGHWRSRWATLSFALPGEARRPVRCGDAPR